MKKLWAIILSVIAAACLVGGLVACGGNGKIDYTVSVLSEGGDKIRNVSVEIYNSDRTETVAEGVTDKKGAFTVRLKPAEYFVTISDLPRGYSAETKAAMADAKGTPVVFYLTSKIITEDIPDTYYYTEGDVMYDYAVNTVDGRQTTFSALLEEKKMIFINLWATTCGPCVSEFPYMLQAFHEAYTVYNEEGTFADEVALVLISSWSSDSNSEVQNFRDTNYPSEQDAYWVFDPSYCMHFASQMAVPASIIVDRYGVFSYFHKGNMTAVSDFTRLFDEYCSPNYSQIIQRPDDPNGEIQRPLNPYGPKDIPSSDEIATAINGTNIDGTKFNGKYHTETEPSAPGGTGGMEYSWPFFIKEEDGKKYIYNSNQGVQSYSFATLYLDYTAKKGDVLAFDYYSDLENGYDILYVLFDGKQQFSTLTGHTDGWQTCYLDVAREDGEYEVVFLYNSDARNPDNSKEEDIVKIRNIRLTNANEMENQDVYLDILFDCTSDFDEDYRVWKTYEKVGYNETDGFYHLLDANNQPNGPLVYLSTMTGTHWSNTSLYDYAVQKKLNFGQKGNYNDFIINYCMYASCSDYVSYVPVTQELKEALDVIADHLGSGGEDEWLEMCVYILRYGAGEPPANPIEGMAPFTAYGLHITDNEYTDETFAQGISNGDLNKIEIKKQPLPRGTYFKFTPDTDGVYEFRSFGEYATICWIADGDEVNSYVSKADYHGLNDETYYDKNFIEYVPMYAHHTYYILLDLYEQFGTAEYESESVIGTYYLSIRNAGNSKTVLSNAAVPNLYTTDGDGTDEEITGNYIIVLLADTFRISKNEPLLSYGGHDSNVFVDVLTPNAVTNDFYSDPKVARMVSLEKIFDSQDGYTFMVRKRDANGNEIKDNDGNFVYVRALDSFTADEITRMRSLIAEAKTNSGTPENGLPPHGMVKVDATVMDILDRLTHLCTDVRASVSSDKVTPNYVENEWLQMCYYYRTYSASAQS